MDIDWETLFVPTNSLLEIAVRGTVIYLVLFVVLRFLPRRTIGAMGPSDILVIVLIADAVQEGMAGSYESITEAIVLAGVIFAWATFIDYLDYRFPHWHLAEAGPLKIVSHGKLLHENMRRQQITEEEVHSQLRQHGQDSIEAVHSAFLEGDGHVSVIVHNRDPLQLPPDRKNL